jgi:hypothetical protein
VANPKPFSQFLRDEVFARPQPSMKHIGQQRFDDCLPPQSMIATQCAVAGVGRHK